MGASQRRNVSNFQLWLLVFRTASSSTYSISLLATANLWPLAVKTVFSSKTIYVNEFLGTTLVQVTYDPR